MSQINETFADRQSRISEAVEDLGLNLEILLTRKSRLVLGLVHVELYKDGAKVGEILYDQEPPTITSSKAEYNPIMDKLKEYFVKNVK